MINKLLIDLINTGKVGSFINNVMIGIESKKGHNELVEKVLRRMEESNLYIKCKQKVREVNFLEVVIKQKGIKIEKEKVKAVLDWPVSKSVNNV